MAGRTWGQLPPSRGRPWASSLAVRCHPQAAACKWVPRSGVLPGHLRGAEVPEACLAPPAMRACTLLPEQTAPPASHALSCTMGAPMGPPHRPSAGGSSSSSNAAGGLTAPVPPPLQGLPATDTLGYQEMAGGRIRPGAFCTVSHMKHLLAANCCSQSPGALLWAFSRLQSKHTDSFSSAA